jgi:hypothetical protein
MDHFVGCAIVNPCVSARSKVLGPRCILENYDENK